MIRAVIIDDEQKGIDALHILCDKFLPELKIVAETTSPHEAIDLIENYKPEIVFLDIQMPGLDGFEMLEKLQWHNFNLVFTTAHQEYALKALKNNAIDYLLKPVDPEDLVSAINRIRQKLNDAQQQDFNYFELLKNIRQSQKQKISVQCRTGIESIDPDDILLLEATSTHTKVVLNDRELLTTKRLKDFEQQLCDEGAHFMRVHHSYIVNLTKVARYLKNTEQIVLRNESKVPVAKSRRDDFFKWLQTT